MGHLVVMGAMIRCGFGTAPCFLNILPANRIMIGGMPAANIMDHAPIVNIPPFGMCTTLSNPAVAKATVAALGVVTPMPCVPATTAPWIPGSFNILIGNLPALTDNSQCLCNYGGVISVSLPGQFSVKAT
jgi:hypothetical protein